MDNDVSLPCLTLKTKFMKTIEISNETLHDNVCKTRLQNHIMKEKEYNSEEDKITSSLYFDLNDIY